MKCGERLIGLLVFAIISLQFVPKSFENRGLRNSSFKNKLNAPEAIIGQLKTSCFDCHSNRTNYPTYSEIQPINYFLNHHIKEGKDKLNFDDFAKYSSRKLNTKLDEISSQLENKEMPLKSYTLIHKDAKLSKAENQKLLEWFRKKRDSIDFSLN